LELTFFGLTAEYRQSIFSQIHEIVFNGRGGYSWNEVYHMPIWIRRYTFSKLREYYESIEKSNKELQNTQSTGIQQSIKGPDISPSYSFKASTK
jgi:hypothetical protein